MDVQLDHIAVQVYGPRNQLLGHIKVPAHVLPDFAKTVVELQQINPLWDAAKVTRWALRSGFRSIRTVLLRNNRTAIPVPGE